MMNIMFNILIKNWWRFLYILERINSPQYPKPYPVSTRRVWEVCALSMQPTYFDFTDFDLEESDNVTVRSSKGLRVTFQGRLPPFRLVVTSMTSILFSSGSLRKGKSVRRFSVQFGVSPSHIQSKYALVTSVE